MSRIAGAFRFAFRFAGLGLAWRHGMGLRLSLGRFRRLGRRTLSGGLSLGLALGGLLGRLSADLLLRGGLLRGAGSGLGLHRLLPSGRLLGVPRSGRRLRRMLALGCLLLSLLLCRRLLGCPRLGFGLLGLHALTRLIASGPVAGPLIRGPGRGARIGRGSGRRPAGLGLDRTLRLTGLTRRLSEGRASRSRRVLRHSSRRPRGLFGALTLGLRGRLSDGRGSVRLVPARPLRLDGSLLR